MIYFDHNASTPVRPESARAIADAIAGLHANPSSLHTEGQHARSAIEGARESVAALIGARTSEIVFTSGGTEADHAGLIGAALALEPRGRRVAISAIEHHAIHGAAHVLERLGWAIEVLPATAEGVVDTAALDALPPDTTLVAVMLANNETGVIQPVAEVAFHANLRGIRTLCDAVQAAGKIPVSIGALGVDYLVISAHKIGGPKGVGALVLRDEAPYEPLFRGSGHERGRRGGTENLSGIVGFGAAASWAAREVETERVRMLALRDRLEHGLQSALADVVIHGAAAERLPNTVNLSVPGARSDHMLMALDARGVAVSAGAACASGAVEPSPVLSAMGVPRDVAVCALRLSMGRTTTAAEVDAVITAVVDSARAARAAGVAA